MFEKKIKFVWGCGVSRQYESISISKNKAPRLLLQMVNWSPFRHYHCFYYHSQCLRIKIKFVWGCGASKQFENISISKNKGPHLYCYKGLSGAHLDITILFTITVNV